MNIGIITGASSGMGKEFVKLTMQNHLELDEIWVIARRKERLEAWSDLYKEQKFRILPLDLQKKEDMDYLGKTLEEVQPHIELFIHCAGFGIMGRIQDISMEEQAEMVDVNCRSVVEVSSLVLPYMKYRGRMIYMASAAAFLPQPGFAVYAASKAFVLSYSRALNEELKYRQIHVLAVCPYWVETEFFDRAVEKDKKPVVIRYGKVYKAKDVIKKAIKDMESSKDVSLYGTINQIQILGMKVLPHRLVKKIWMIYQDLNGTKGIR